MNFKFILKKENLLLIPLIYPLSVAVWGLLTGGAESRMPRWTMPLSTYEPIRNWSALCAMITFIVCYVLIKSNILYKLVTALNLTIVGMFVYDIFWNYLYHLATGIEDVFFGMTIWFIPTVMFFIVTCVISLCLKTIKFSIWNFILFLIMLGSLVLLYQTGFFTSWYYSYTVDPHNISRYGFLWMISKALGCFMWVPAVRRT